MNLKHKSSNLKHRKKKTQVAKMDSYPHQPRSLKQRRLIWGGTWLLIIFVAGDVSALEVDASAVKAEGRCLGYQIRENQTLGLCTTLTYSNMFLYTFCYMLTARGKTGPLPMGCLRQVENPWGFRRCFVHFRQRPVKIKKSRLKLTLDVCI